jgi:hypothetical protein
MKLLWQLTLIKSSQPISHVKWLKLSVSGTISVPIIRLMVYLCPEHPTCMHAGAHVQAKCKPRGFSEVGGYQDQAFPKQLQ